MNESAYPMGHNGNSVHEGDVPPAIQLVGISKKFKFRKSEEVRAVDNLDLTISDGEFFSFLGPSGCGKSTTLRMVAGLEEPSSGQVFLQGRDVTWEPANRREVNMVFQNYALFPHMNIFNNIAYGLLRRKVDKAEIRRSVGEILELVELPGYERRRPAQLSGGQQQRVALARALVNRPRALLLDEPLSALDFKLRQAMQLELKRIQREVGIAFLYVTHDQGEALAMSDRIAVMNGGRIEQLATPAEIYERPATSFVAGFIGKSNLFSGRAEHVVGNLARLDFGDSGQILVPADPSVKAGGQIEVIVRPEQVRITKQPPDEDRCRLPGQLTGITYQGNSTLYTVSTKLGVNVEIFNQNTDVKNTDFAEGDAVWVMWSPEQSYALQGGETVV